MARAPTKRRIASDAWKSFYQSPDGRVAIAALMREFGFYSTPDEVETNKLVRSIGQRDVLSRIVELINLKPETAPADEQDQTDILDNVMRFR
jgi:hypothetical protein